MRYAKEREPDTLARDAALVQELYSKFTRTDSATNEKAYFGACDWFTNKHHCDWKNHIKPEERQR